MTPKTQRTLKAPAATGLACALAMLGCDSKSPARGTTIPGAKLDGGGIGPDLGSADAPLGGGGGVQGGGGNPGGLNAGGGGTYGTAASGAVGGYGGGALMGGNHAGGAGGKSVGAGGAGGAVGVGGRGGNGGTLTAPGRDGGGQGGASGQSMPACSQSILNGVYSPCDNVGLSGYCADPASGHEVCVCNEENQVECVSPSAARCPAAAMPGGFCESLTKRCYYAGPGILCECRRRENGFMMFDCFPWPQQKKDAAPPVDVGPMVSEKLVVCSAEPSFGACSDSTLRGREMKECGTCTTPPNAFYYTCLLPDGHTICGCENGTWFCPKGVCPPNAQELEICEPIIECKNESGKLCHCVHWAGDDAGVDRFSCHVNPS